MHLAHGFGNVGFSKVTARSGLMAQLFDVTPKRAKRRIERVQHLSAVRNLFFRGNHGHSDTYLSVGSPDQADMKKRPPGIFPVAACPSLPACQNVYVRPNAKSIKTVLTRPYRTARSMISTPWRCPRGDTPKRHQSPPPVDAPPAAAAPRSASIRRHTATFALCSAKVTANACPPVPSATKKI